MASMGEPIAFWGLELRNLFDGRATDAGSFDPWRVDGHVATPRGALGPWGDNWWDFHGILTMKTWYLIELAARYDGRDGEVLQ